MPLTFLGFWRFHYFDIRNYLFSIISQVKDQVEAKYGVGDRYEPVEYRIEVVAGYLYHIRLFKLFFVLIYCFNNYALNHFKMGGTSGKQYKMKKKIKETKLWFIL